MVTVKADDRRRIQIPDIKAGQIFALENHGNGTITLTLINPTAHKGSVLGDLKPLTKEECDRCWGPASDDAENDRIAAAMSQAPFPKPEDIE